MPSIAWQKALVTIFKVIVGVGLSLGVLTAAAIGQEIDQRFCAVPIMPAGDGPAQDTWRLVDTRFDVPGLPAPIFTPITPGGRPWTISRERKIVLYDKPFPRSYLESKSWIREAWSGRVVLTLGGGVSVIVPGSDQFKEIVGPYRTSGRHFGAIAVVPRRHLTVVVDRIDGLFLLKGDSLEPWFSTDQLRSLGVNGISELYDSALLSALIIRDTDGNVYALTDDDKWERVGLVDKSASGYFVDTPGSGAAIFLSRGHFAFVMRKNSPGAKTHFAAETFNGSDFYVSSYFGQLVRFQRMFLDWGGWQRLTPTGFAGIVGGDFAPAERDGVFVLRDLPTLKRALLEGSDGLYLYDGATIQRVKGGSYGDSSEYHRVYDLPSIGRVLLVSKLGVFELTNDGKLIAQSMPFPTDLTFPQPQFVDWPRAGMALAATKRGIFSVDQALNARPILGGDRIALGGLDFNHGEMTDTGEPILSGKSGVFLAVDARGQGAPLCQRERDLQQAIPQSSLCLRAIPGIPGRDDHTSSRAVGGMIEAPRGQGVLVDTPGGIVLLSADGKLVKVESRHGDVRPLETFPWSEDVFAVGYGGSIVHSDLSREELDKVFIPDATSASMRVALVETADHSNHHMLLRFEAGKYEILKFALNDMQLVEQAFDTPWLGGMLTLVDTRLFLLQRDASLTPLVTTNAGSPVPSVRNAFYSRVLFGLADIFAVNRLETIYARNQQTGWFRLTRERQWLPIRGLPNELALAHFDPGQGDVLFGLGSGIYAVDVNGDARKVDEPNGPRRIVRAFADAGDVILAGGDDGLFEISKDLSRVTEVTNGSAEATGSVSEIIKVGFAKLDIVRASNGTFTFEDGVLKRIPNASIADEFNTYRVFEGARRVLATKPFDHDTPLFELHRSDENGQCSRDIVDVR